MNYGKNATEKRIKKASSNAEKYTSRIFLTIFKAGFILCLFTVLVTASTCFGMFMGIIDSAPAIDVESIIPMGYATTVYDSAGNLTDTLVMAGANREEASYD